MPKPHTTNSLRRRLASAFATWGYVGYLPKAPGTFGSLAALPFAWYLWQMDPLASWPFLLGFVGLGCWAGEIHDNYVGGHDTQTIVVDEVAGIFLVAAFAHHTVAQYVLVFVLFRIFDIWKPWPVRGIDRRVEGGFGVMADDLGAAAYAALVLFVVNRYFPGLV